MNFFLLRSGRLAALSKLRPARRLFSGTGLLLLLVLAAASPAADFDHTHALLDRSLKAHVTNALVNYPALKAAPQQLDAYLAACAAVTEATYEKWPEPQRLAFLINLYNAATLRLILDHYPVKSIKKIGGFFSGPWDQPVVRLFGKSTTLGAVEHELLRVQFDEPRLHFAIVCAARGCAPLRSEAYVADRIEQQFDEQGKAFLSNTAKNSVDVKTRTLYLSPIFKWFAEDFERGHGSVAKFIAPYFPAAVRNELVRGDFRVKYTDYDWSLNEATAAKK